MSNAPATPRGPNPAPLFELSVAYWRSCALFAALELGLFGALASEALTPAALAARLQVAERPLAMLLKALAALNLVAVKDGAYGLTDLSRCYLVPGSPASLEQAILFNARAYGAWGQLSQALRRDAPPQAHEHILGQDPAATRNFVMAMHARAKGAAACLAALLDLSGCQSLLDLGGGPGTYSAMLAQRFPNLRCTVMDLAPVLAVAAELVAQSPAQDRITLHPGDAFRDELPRGFDAVLISGVLHRTEGEGTVAFLRQAAASLRPGGLLAVSDLFTGRGDAGPVLPELFSLHMLITANQGQSPDLTEMRGYFRQAGLEPGAVLPYPAPLPHTLCLARKPQ